MLEHLLQHWVIIMLGRRITAGSVLLGLLTAGCADEKYQTIHPVTAVQSYTADGSFPRDPDKHKDYLVVRDADGQEVRLRGPRNAVRHHMENRGLFSMTYPEGSEADLNDVKVSPDGYYRGVLTGVEGYIRTTPDGRPMDGVLTLKITDVNGVEIEARYTPDARTTAEYNASLRPFVNRRIVTVSSDPGRIRSLGIEEPLP